MEKLIMRLYRARVPTLFLGPPGVGKTATLEEFAKKVRAKLVLPSIRNPEDIALPVVRESGPRMEPIGEFARAAALAAEGELVIVFLDELTTLPPAAQGAALRFLDSGWVGGVRIPPSVWRIAAANPPELAAGGYDLEAPTANRLVHIEWRIDPLEWAQGFASYWGHPPNVGDLTEAAWAPARALVAGFIRSHPDLLIRVPEDPVSRGQAWPSPRTWDFASRVLASFENDAREAAPAIIGAVGKAAGLQFIEWAARLSLPTVDDLLSDPEGVLSRVSSDAVYTLLAGAGAILRNRLLEAKGADTQKLWGVAWHVAQVAARHCRDIAAGTLVHELCLLVRERGWRVPGDALAPYVELLRQAGALES